MGFKNNYSQAEDFSGIKPEGFYEVLIVKAEEKKAAKSGKVFLNLSMVIRNDVTQKFKNGYIFLSLWKRKEPTALDMQVKGYDFGQVMALGKAAGLPDGKDYSGLEEFLGDLIGKPVRVKLKHEEYNGTIQERVDYMQPTNFATVRHVMKKNVDVAADDYAKPAASYAAPAQTPDMLLDDDDLVF